MSPGYGGAVTYSRDAFIDQVNRRCAAFLEERRAEVSAISADGAPLVEALSALTSGGKKLRPALGWIGWRGAGGDPAPGSAAEDLGVALELFQAAALVHDDVIDRSSTRRGQPSTHVRFEELHRGAGFSGQSHHFGTSGAILSGDLALAWAGQAYAQAEVASGAVTRSDALARETFQRMHTSVITGQYLDVLAEVRRPAPTEAEAVARARGVLRHKSAKYSTEYPVVLGCALAGGSPALSDAFADAALPAGEAFQLRDDILGIFGDPETTGKPVGDDLREGKRTELIAYGLFRSSEAESEQLSRMLGDPDLSEGQVDRAREILVSSGALAEVERSIEELVEQSRRAEDPLRQAGVDDAVLDEFAEVRERLVRRSR